MKVRNGFVSNSSSSSFIIGVGIVSNEALLEKHGDVEIYSASDIICPEGEPSRWWSPYNYNSKTDRLEVESFTYDCVGFTGLHAHWVENPDAKVAVLRYCGGEDDHAFMPESDDDDWGYAEPDYDIDMDFFDEDEHEMVDDFMAGTINGDWSYGAGRDG